MAHKHKKKHKANDEQKATNTAAPSGTDGAAAAPLSRKEYEAELKHLHAELVKLQLWVKHTGAKICIVFEGRDGAGKGGVIKAIMERVSPRKIGRAHV